MKKHLIIIISLTIIIFAGLIAVYFFVKSDYNKQEYASPVDLQNQSFEAVGVLAKDLPGQRGYMWHLIFEEQNGKTGMVELGFPGYAECFGRIFELCNEYQFNKGDRVKVTGYHKIDNEVVVEKIEILIGNPYPTDILEWKRYFNPKLEFSFSHPANWKIETPSLIEQEMGVVVKFQGPYGELRKSLGDQVYNNDLVISYWPSINDVPEVRASDKSFSNLGAMMKSSDFPSVKSQGIYTIGGYESYRVEIGGAGTNDGVMFERNGVYQLSFETIHKDQILGQAYTNIIDLITSTIRFVN